MPLYGGINSSTQVSRLAVKVRSIMDTFGVGTRTEENVQAVQFRQNQADGFAAPVDVGIMDCAAARARRGPCEAYRARAGRR